MKLTLLSADDIRRALPMPAAIAAMKEAFAALSAGRANVPQRTALPVPEAEGLTLVMPGYLAGAGLATKLVSVFPNNAAKGLPVIQGLVVVLDPETGAPSALLDGTFLTAWRTGAASGAATDLLARPEARTAALFGCGAQARTQVLAIDAVRQLETIRVYAPTAEHVTSFIAEMQGEVNATLEAAASPKAAVKDADIICTATTSATPVFNGQDLAPGTHINGVGSYTTAMQEVDATTVQRARIFVDARDAALEEAGDLVIPIRSGQTQAAEWIELGEVIAGHKPGRTTPREITFFKSVGVAVQDVVAAGRALTAAAAQELGMVVEI